MSYTEMVVIMWGIMGAIAVAIWANCLRKNKRAIYLSDVIALLIIPILGPVGLIFVLGAIPDRAIWRGKE